MDTAAKPTRENRTITVDFRDEATYCRLMGDGKAFVECVLAFILSLGFQDSGPVWWEVFLGAMRELNYVQGRNLFVKFAFADDQPARLAGLAGDLVRARVDVIVTTSVSETRAARQATSTCPLLTDRAPCCRQ